MKYLGYSLLTHEATNGGLVLNFHYEVSRLTVDAVIDCKLKYFASQLKLALTEIRYLRLFGEGDIPTEAADLSDQEETFRQYTTRLTSMIIRSTELPNFAIFQ
jgi:hypothetical protein